MKNQGRDLKKYRMSTMAIHAGEDDPQPIRPVSLPIYQSNAYGFHSYEEAEEAFSNKYERYVYTRLGNPTVRALEEKISALEGAEASIATASGMGAISSAVLGLARGASHVVCFSKVYGGTNRLLREILVPFGIETTFVEPADAGRIETFFRNDTRILYLESPMNPSMELLDIASLGRIARSRGILTIFDNTFATPCTQRPLSLGADIVVHSASKYLCGHGDALGGIVAGDTESIAGIRDRILTNFGGVISPFNAWLILRGMQTLSLRMERHCRNAQALAEFLEGHPQVLRVNYPGLASFPQADLAGRQMEGFGGVLSFDLRGGAEAARTFMNNLELCTISGSLGDSKTLVIHPASMSHRGLSTDARRAAGIGDGLVRIATGLEDTSDIISDVRGALAHCG
jgi:methionine-gamma-lyase